MDLKRKKWWKDKPIKICEWCLRNIIILFKKEITEEYYKPACLNIVLNSSYIEYESSDDQNKMLPIKEYLEEIWPY